MKNICELMIQTGAGALKAAVPMMLLLSIVSCGKRGGEASADDAAELPRQFHADNDIAMTVRSLVDAVRVGESLDSSDYNFTGILTDGQGAPLYTDVEGSPGQWMVKVESPAEAQIRNLYVGDLMAGDLQNYIISALNLTSADLATVYRSPDNENEEVALYDLGDARLRFVTSEAESPSGLEGALLAIYVSKQ